MLRDVGSFAAWWKRIEKNKNSRKNFTRKSSCFSKQPGKFARLFFFQKSCRYRQERPPNKHSLPTRDLPCELGLTTGGSTLAGKDRERKCVTIAVNLTESEKNAIEQCVAALDFDTPTLARRLIWLLLSGKRTLPELLLRYKDALTGNEFTNKAPELRIHRIAIRISQREKEKLAVLADEAFYRPGKLVRILLQLLALGIIELSEIWK
jgi:hypothetical protein